ncbi:MAG TPA: dihydrodipicolinate synthase family protein [Solirubrobacteraceae bacterium]|nr:dihydrodipicolinate synthase family protein [Solirubrobacteraceae bacterium]
MVEARISGTLAAAVTPLRDGGARLDEDALAPLLDFYRASGLDGLLVLGTTGEGILLDDGERRRVAELALAGAAGMPVVVHCGAQTTTQTCALSAHAAEVGAQGVAVIAPPYFAFDQTELVEHFAAAAAACAPLPFYIYEYAERSGYVVSPAVVEEVRGRASNLVGMKVSDAPFARVEPYLATGLDVFVGAEGVIAEGMEHGAVGAVSGVAAAFPEAVAALVRNPTPERSALVQSLRSALSARPFQASVKAALAHRGVPVRPDVRAPLRALSDEAATALGAELERLLGAASASSERTIRVIRHVEGPLKDTIIEVVEDEGGALRLVTTELHVCFDGQATGTVEDITPSDLRPPGSPPRG